MTNCSGNSPENGWIFWCSEALPRPRMAPSAAPRISIFCIAAIPLTYRGWWRHCLPQFLVAYVRAIAHGSPRIRRIRRFCRVHDLDALIRTKRAAGRPKDLEVLAELELLREPRGKSGSK